MNRIDMLSECQNHMDHNPPNKMQAMPKHQQESAKTWSIHVCKFPWLTSSRVNEIRMLMTIISLPSSGNIWISTSLRRKKKKIAFKYEKFQVARLEACSPWLQCTGFCCRTGHLLSAETLDVQNMKPDTLTDQSKT